MNRRAAGVVFMSLAIVIYVIGTTPTIYYHNEANAAVLFLGVLGGFYLYLAETEKPKL